MIVAYLCRFPDHLRDLGAQLVSALTVQGQTFCSELRAAGWALNGRV